MNYNDMHGLRRLIGRHWSRRSSSRLLCRMYVSFCDPLVRQVRQLINPFGLSLFRLSCSFGIIVFVRVAFGVLSALFD